MKLLMISIALAGAGGLVVHAKDSTSVIAPKIDDRSKRFKIERSGSSFILAPLPQCVVDNKVFEKSISACVNAKRTWLKAI